MRNTTKTLIVVLGLLTIGAGSAFAGCQWLSWQWGTCSDFMRPFSNWAFDEHPDYGDPIIEGTWYDDVGNEGFFYGELEPGPGDLIYKGPWYKLTMITKIKLGDFVLVCQPDVLGPDKGPEWNGIWIRTSTNESGRMRGYCVWVPDE